MTPEEQRIAIAEACGWTNCTFNPAKGEPKGCLPNESFLGEFTCPHYLNDLNAMHEAEKVLSQEQRVNYCNTLAKVCNTEKDKIFATASQRAEAFLKTLNLWKQ